MPSLDLDENRSQFQIRAYRAGIIKINDQTYTRSLIITPDQLFENWQPQTLTELSADSFSLILELKPDVLLIGTGASFEFVAVELYGHLINAGIGVEVMDTLAACRTYNALSAENRRVAAALLIN